MNFHLSFQELGNRSLCQGIWVQLHGFYQGPKVEAMTLFLHLAMVQEKVSRTAARNQIDSSELKLQLEQNGINVHTKTPNVLSEESFQMLTKMLTR